MEPEEKQESTSPLPVLPRLDRLDHLLQLLEEKHSLSGRHRSKPVVTKTEPEYQSKTLYNALEEVHHKGTLMGRVEMLEKRVLQLSLDMDEGNTSRSSSSTVTVSEKFGHSSGLSMVTKEDEDAISDLERKRDPILIQEEKSAQAAIANPQNHHYGRKQKRKSYKKWRGWFRIGC